MDIMYTDDNELLAHLADSNEDGDLHGSPEQFLIWLEESLESGDLTVDEAILLIKDFNRRN